MKIFIIKDRFEGRLTQFIAKDTEKLREKVSEAKKMADKKYYKDGSDWKTTFYEALNENLNIDDEIKEFKTVEM